MSAVLSEAETKFFSSRGQEVDASLKPAEAPVEEQKTVATPPAAPTQAPPTAANGLQQPPTTETPNPQHVPLTALHEERRARQQAERESQQLQQQVQQFQQQLEQIQKAQQAPPPDPQQDPIGAMMHQARINQEQLAQIEQWRTQQEQYTQQIVARQQFNQAITNSEQAFAAKNPDYWQAAKFAQQQYDKMLMALIPDPAQRQQRVMQEALSVAYSVMQQGRDPAEFFYQFAKDMGYTGQQQSSVPSQQGVTPPAQSVTPVMQTVPEVVKTIERGLKQQAAPGGGSTPNSEITPEMALTLPGEDFNKWWAKQFRR